MNVPSMVRGSNIYILVVLILFSRNRHLEHQCCSSMRGAHRFQFEDTGSKVKGVDISTLQIEQLQCVQPKDVGTRGIPPCTYTPYGL